MRRDRDVSPNFPVEGAISAEKVDIAHFNGYYVLAVQSYGEFFMSRFMSGMRLPTQVGTRETIKSEEKGENIFYGNQTWSEI